MMSVSNMIAASRLFPSAVRNRIFPVRISFRLRIGSVRTYETVAVTEVTSAFSILSKISSTVREPVEKHEMLYYKTDKLGLLPRSVMELKTLRNQYKTNMKNSSTKEDYNKWNNNQMAVKRLMASFYGIVGNKGFGWCDIDLAASITASSREAIREAAFKVREL